MALQSTIATATARPVAADTEKRAYRKVFWHIVPFLMLCYVVAYLDRVNVGFAKLEMSSDLGFSELVFGIGAGIFFLGYFLFEIPSNLLLHRVGARAWIARIMITWGILSGCFVFVTGEVSFYVLRFLLGIAEAGFYPGIILYLTYWFPSHRRAKIIAVFMAAIPIAGIFGNPLSGWIMESFHDASGMSGWQWMFLIEAVPAVILGVCVILLLRNSIREAKWLTEEEKQVLERAIAEDEKKKETTHSLRAVFADRRVWIMAFIYFSIVMGQYGLTFWMPTLVKASGVVGTFNIGLVSAIPFLTAVGTMIRVGHSADRHRERRWHLAVPCVAGAVGFVVAGSSGNVYVAISALSVAAGGVLAATPLFWSLPTAFLQGAAAAAGIALINSVGNLSGFVSPFLIGFIRDETGSAEIGLYLLAGILVLGALVVLAQPAKLVNR